MALPASGTIKMSEIKAALGSTSNSLRAYAVVAKAATGLAKFDAPDLLSEFYSYAAPTPAPPTPAPPTPPPPTPPPPTPAPPTQTTFTGFVSTIDEGAACDGGEYGLVTITIFGTTLCDATSIRALSSATIGNLYADFTNDQVFYVNRLGKVREFTRVGPLQRGNPTTACSDCPTPPPPTPPPPTPAPPTPAPPTPAPPTPAPPTPAPPTPAPPTPPPPTPPPPTPPPPTPAPLPIYNAVYLSSGTDPCDAKNNSGGIQA